MLARIYTNAILLMLLATACSISFTTNAASWGLEKTAFIFAATLAGGFLSVGMTFASKELGNGSKVTPLNLNVLIAVATGFLTIGTVFLYLPTSVYLDLVAEGLVSGLGGTAVGIIMAFAKKDGDDHNDEH